MNEAATAEAAVRKDRLMMMELKLGEMSVGRCNNCANRTRGAREKTTISTN